MTSVPELIQIFNFDLDYAGTATNDDAVGRTDLLNDWLEGELVNGW